MKTYIVGGAVRDSLLGLLVQDRDHVVIGATPEQMLAKGFTPVGKDFPVFLHPKTHEEYALARTERKTAAGYKGFVFHTDEDVSLEQDLIRRDLTINAIARDEDGVLIDPFHGQQDLQNKIFRHVSDAFAEDPVRILRLARFAARFSIAPHDFVVAAETMSLMRLMVARGEVDALVPERVWQELSRGLMEAKPSRMFEVLRECGALARLSPELDALWSSLPLAQPRAMQMVNYAAEQAYSLPIRFAALMQDLGKTLNHRNQLATYDTALIEAACERLKVPSDCRDLAIMTARDHGNVENALEMQAEELQELFERSDAFRKPQRFLAMLTAVECADFSRLEVSYLGSPQANFLKHALAAVQAVNAGAVAQAYLGQPQKIAEAIRAARLAALQGI